MIKHKIMNAKWAHNNGKREMKNVLEEIQPKDGWMKTMAGTFWAVNKNGKLQTVGFRNKQKIEAIMSTIPDQCEIVLTNGVIMKIRKIQ